MPKKIIDIEASSDDNTDNDSYKEESEPEKLTKSTKKTLVDKPKKVLSEKQKAVLEGARKKRLENIATAKTNKKIEAAKLLIEQDTNLKLKEHHEAKFKTKTIIIQSESESSSEEEIVIKKKRSKKPKQVVKEESESEEEVKEEQKPTKQRQLKAQISTNKLNKHNIFDGFV